MSRRGALAALLALALAADAWVFARREAGFSFLPCDALTLRWPAEALVLEEARLEEAPGGAALRLELAPAPPGWSVAAEGEGETVSTGAARLPLAAGERSYLLRARGATTLPAEVRLRVRYDPAAPAGAARVSLLACDVPLAPAGGRYAVEAFAATPAQYAPAEVAAARAALALPANLTARARLDATARFLLAGLERRRGVPSPELDAVSPWRQWEATGRGEAAVWCTQIAAITRFFAACAGLSAREVHLGGRLGELWRAGHVLNEVFLPEQARWALVDLTTGVVGVEGAGGEPLDALALQQVLEAGAGAALTARVWRDGAIVRVPFAEVSPLLAPHLHASARLVYPLADADRRSLASKLLRYTLRPDPTHDPGGSRLRHGLKLALLAATAGLALGLALSLLARRPRAPSRERR